jgi:hypothetical protein
MFFSSIVSSLVMNHVSRSFRQSRREDQGTLLGVMVVRHSPNPMGANPWHSQNALQKRLFLKQKMRAAHCPSIEHDFTLRSWLLKRGVLILRLLATAGLRGLPLSVGAGGLAILAAIAEDERREVIDRVSPNLKAFGNLTAEALEASCRQVQVPEN